MILGYIARRGLKPRWTARELAATHEHAAYIEATRIVDGDQLMVVRRTVEYMCAGGVHTGFMNGCVVLNEIQVNDHVFGPDIEPWSN